MKQTTILCTIGTRPEAIKMAPVILALRQSPWADCRVLVTGQHRELLHSVLAFFGISADVDLSLMTENQTLPDLQARMLVALDRTLADERPALVLAQGDTTSVMTTALACFYRRIPFGHVEAGLRTHNLFSPFPEEANRLIAGRLASLHFAPTSTARDNLLREGIPPDTIHVTGNTVIDALLLAVRRNEPIGVPLDPAKRLILITAHRRDSFGEPLHEICRAVATLSQRYADVEFLWPVHPNPNVKAVVDQQLGKVRGVRLCAPLSYGQFVTTLNRSHLILTDSGGVQEEAPALGKPVLVMREQSERPEAFAAGAAFLVGPNEDRIVKGVSHLLDTPAAYRKMSKRTSPYGDGCAAARIVDAIEHFSQRTHAGCESTLETEYRRAG